MVPLQNVATYLPIFQSSGTASQVLTGVVDRLTTGGLADYVEFTVMLPTGDVVSNKPTALKLSESDDATTYADVTGFVGGTDFAIPNVITSASNIVRPYAMLGVDCKARKRYLKITITPATTQVVNVLAQLGRTHATPAGTQSALVVVNG